MTNVFAVVGEHRAAPERLLLLGEDGRYYALAADGRPIEVEPSGAWCLDDGTAGEPAAVTETGVRQRPRGHVRRRSARRPDA